MTTSIIGNSHIQALIDILGSDNVHTDKQRIAPYLSESRGLITGDCLAWLTPTDRDSIQQLVRYCAAQQISIVPQGGNTSRVAGTIATDKQVIINLKKLNAITHVDTSNDTIGVQAGCILADAQAAAEAKGRSLGINIGSAGSCQLGGNIASNAGGLNVLHYGNTREQVLGLEAVLANGECWSNLSGLRKDNTGYDLKQLFIGSEGTLGIITAATLKLHPPVSQRAVALCCHQSVTEAVNLLQFLRANSPATLLTFELIPQIALDFREQHLAKKPPRFQCPSPWYSLLVLASPRQQPDLSELLAELLAAAMAEKLLSDAVIGDSLQQNQTLLAIREEIVPAQKHGGAGIKHDISVPISQIPALFDKLLPAAQACVPGIRPYPYGHIGDGNIHFNFCQPTDMSAEAFAAKRQGIHRIAHDIAHELGGSISAEHGIGLIKRDELPRYKSTIELQLMQQIKSLLDPHGLFNPDKLLPAAIT